MNLAILRSIQALSLALAMACSAPVLAQSAHKVGPDHLAKYWILLNTKVDVDLPNSGRNLDKPGCVAVTYQIGTDGVPRNLAVARVVPDSDLGSAASSAVSDLRYGPSLTNRSSEPVATYYVASFNLPDDPAQRAAISARCQLPGYDN